MTSLANSTMDNCIPRQSPRNGILCVRAYLIASSIPSIPRLPKPPGTRIPLTSPRISSTLRLGSYPCVLNKDSKAYKLYGSEEIQERHRHRYEVNNDYRDVLTQNGMLLSGLSPDGRIVEMVEIPDHPWFIATQAHPELKSRPNRPHPLFRGFIEASLEYQKEHK